MNDRARPNIQSIDYHSYYAFGYSLGLLVQQKCLSAREAKKAARSSAAEKNIPICCWSDFCLGFFDAAQERKIMPENVLWFAYAQQDKEIVETIKVYIVGALRPQHIAYTFWDNNMADTPEELNLLLEKATVFLPCFSVYAVNDERFIDLVEHKMLQRSKEHPEQPFIPIRIQKTGYESKESGSTPSILGRAAAPRLRGKPLAALSGHALLEAYNEIALILHRILGKKVK